MTTDAPNIRATLYAAVAEQMQESPEQYEPETHFYDDIGMDSLDTIEICMTLEERLHITIDETQLDQVLTLGQMEQHLQALVAAAARAKGSKR